MLKKLKLFHLKNKLDETTSGAAYFDSDDDKIMKMLEDRDIRLRQLTDANSIAQQKIFELESEVLSLRTEIPDTLASNRLTGNAYQLNESLKHEREAVKAITEHDNSIIADLEKELVGLRQKHESDGALLNELVERVRELMAAVEAKDQQLKVSTEALKNMHERFEILQDRLKRQDMILLSAITQQGFNPNSKEKINDLDLSQIPGSPMSPYFGAITQRISILPTSFPEDNDEALFDRVAPLTAADARFNLGMLASGSKYDKEEIDSLRRENAMLFSQLEQFQQLRQQNLNLVDQMSELDEIRAQNAKLSEIANQEKKKRIKQEKALERLQASAEEITLLEAEEIARLQTELEKVNIENKRFRRDLKSLNDELKKLRKNESAKNVTKESQKFQRQFSEDVLGQVPYSIELYRYFTFHTEFSKFLKFLNKLFM